MHQGCVRWRQRRRGGQRRGGGRHRQALGGAGGVLHPRAGHRPRSSTCPATASPQAAGTAPAPAALGCRAKHRWPGSSAMFEGRHPDTGELLGRPHGRNAVPAFDVVLRPTKSVSILYGLGRPGDRPGGAGRPSRRRRRGGRLPGRAPGGPPRPRRSSSMCPDRGCWRSGSTTGRPGRVTRCCTPIWWWPTASRARTDAGRPWTAGTCTGIGWPPTPSTGPAYQRELSGRSGWSGRRPTATATGSSRACPRSWSGCSPSAPTRSTWRSSGWRPTGGSGHRGWSSGPSTPPASPRSTRPRTPCMDGGGRRRPSAAMDPDTLVRQVTGRTRDRDQDLSERTVAEVFDRLAGPDGLTAHRVHLRPPGRDRRPRRPAGRRHPGRARGAGRPVPGRADGGGGGRAGAGGAPLVHPRAAGRRAAAGRRRHRPRRRADRGGVP